MGSRRDGLAIRGLQKRRCAGVGRHQHQRIERLDGGEQALARLTHGGFVSPFARAFARNRLRIQKHGLVQPDARARRRKGRARRGGQLVAVRHAHGRIRRTFHGGLERRQRAALRFDIHVVIIARSFHTVSLFPPTPCFTWHNNKT